VYPNLGMLLRSTFRSTQPNPIAGRTFFLNNVHLLSQNSTALKIITVKSKNVVDSVFKGFCGILVPSIWREEWVFLTGQQYMFNLFNYSVIKGKHSI
jgi:hypothetical protein